MREFVTLRAGLPPEDSGFRQLARQMPVRLETKDEIADITARLRA